MPQSRVSSRSPDNRSPDDVQEPHDPFEQRHQGVRTLSRGNTAAGMRGIFAIAEVDSDNARMIGRISAAS